MPLCLLFPLSLYFEHDRGALTINPAMIVRADHKARILYFADGYSIGFAEPAWSELLGLLRLLPPSRVKAKEG
jgi:hypothetical protein